MTMSVERSKYYLPGRIKHLEERQQPTVTYPSWETTIGKLNLMTNNNPTENELISENRKILKDSYDAWFNFFVKRNRIALDRFSRRYTKNKKSRSYNPELIDKLGPYISYIRDSFPKPRG